ncbi:MAG: CDP-alcohol phosphatidyltransferase family protein [Nitriliruptorales bacterium]
MALDARTRRLWLRAFAPVGRGLARLGITANHVTALGLVLTAVAAWLVVRGDLVLAGWVLVGGSLADAFDGAVARARDEVTVAGGFYDSVADRLSDGVILAAVLWAVGDDPLLFALAAVALVTAQVTSYVRAKAESLGVSCAVGLIERGERAIIITVGLVFHRWLLGVALWVLAVGGTVTVAQRIAHVLPKLRALPHPTRQGGTEA